MDFRVKKLILEEGMKNIAETEGVKLEMKFDDLHRKVDIIFKGFTGACDYHMSCSYADINDDANDAFKAIENTRAAVQLRKRNRDIDFEGYCRNDIRQTAKAITLLQGSHFGKFPTLLPKIKNVIFNYPATIVFWADGDKTVVKCQPGDLFDAEKGLAMAIVKKAYGGKGNYCEVFKPWLEEYDEKERETLERVIAGIAEKWPNSFEYLVPQGTIDAQKDLEDILEGKVDPLMIKADEEEETEENTGTLGLCKECKHYDLDGREEPCVNCRSICAEHKHSYWEPKE